MHIAASKKWSETCKILLKKANVNARNSKEETALHKAATTGDKKTILILLENKADVKAKVIFSFKTIFSFLKSSFF